MTWTYDVTALETSSLMQVRLLVGDTVQAAPLIADEEIAFHVSAQTNVYYAAANVAESIAAFFARKVDKSVNRQSISVSQQQAQYTDLAKRLRIQAPRMGSVFPYASGYDPFDKFVNDLDTSVERLDFRRGMMDSPISSIDSDLAGEETRAWESGFFGGVAP